MKRQLLQSLQRKLLPAFIVFLLTMRLAAAQCGDVTLSSQAEVDNFATNYPGCTEVGNLTISGNDITNLNELLSLQKIDGDLHIVNCPLLTNVNGLSNITGLGGSLQIKGNNVLSNIAGLANIDHNTISSLTIKDNPELAACRYENICVYLFTGKPKEISGNNANCYNENDIKYICAQYLPPSCPGDVSLTSQAQVDDFALYPRCTIVNGSLVISGSDITNLNGLVSIKEITGALYISGCTSLTDISGLSSLEGIGGRLSIGDNSLLSNINGLQALKSVGEYLLLENNPELTDVSGLQ